MDRMHGQATWRIVRDSRGWTVQRDGEVVGRHAGRAEALEQVQQAAARQGPAHVVVHGEDGGVVWSAVYNGKPAAPGPAEEQAV